MARRCWSSALSSDMKGRSIELLKVKNLSLYRSPICQVHEEPAKLEALMQQGPEWEQLLALSNRHGVMPLLYRSLGQEDRQPMTQG